MREVYSFEAGGYACYAWLPPQAAQGPVHGVYCNGGDSLRGILDEVLDAVEPRMGGECLPFAIVGIEPHSWERDYSPWAAPALNKKSAPFEGGCDAYLDALPAIIDETERRFPLLREREGRAMAGYSLGGLAALYALYRTAYFGRVASLSGSLWFPGFAAYAMENPPAARDTRVYLSLGRAEEKSRHPLMGQVGDCTRGIYGCLEQWLTMPPRLEWNEGGHFTEIPQRWTKALLWLMAP